MGSRTDGARSISIPEHAFRDRTTSGVDRSANILQETSKTSPKRQVQEIASIVHCGISYDACKHKQTLSELHPCYGSHAKNVTILYALAVY